MSPAWAHGTSGVESVGGFGPLIMLFAAGAFILYLVVESKWRKRNRNRDDRGED